MVCDGWSMGVFTRELESLYGAFVAGEPSPLPDLPIQFGDFATWERRRMTGTNLHDHLAYWREQLAGAPEDPLLPLDRPRPQEPSFAGAHLPIRLSKPLSREIRALSRRGGVTVFHTLLAAFNVLLYSMSGQEDVVVGSTFANRAHTQLEGLIGYFVNVLPLRSDLSGNPRFDELQRRACEVTLAVSAHQELSLVKLVRELQPERDLSRNPLFQVVFYYLTLDHNPAVYGFGISPVMDVVELPGLTMTPLDFECGIARFDIAILIWDTPQGLSGTIEYSTALFDASTIKGLVDDYEAVVRHVTGEPQPRLKTVAAALATDREQRRDQRRENFRSRMQEKLQAIGKQPGRRKG
jgi:non-ribosomal peptide synthetase component F